MLIKFPIQGRKETQFWVRAFQLEKEIDRVTAIMNAKPERKLGFCPMIYEYTADKTFFVCLIGAQIDALGITDGMGFIWITRGEKHKLEALKERDGFANEMFSAAEGRPYDEVVEIDSGKEV